MLRNILNAAFLAAMAIVMIAANAQAQSNTAAVNASATVLSELTLGHNGTSGAAATVTFGDISGTTAGIPYLDPTGTATNYVGTGASEGSFEISGSAGHSVTVTWPAYVSMVGASSDSLQWTLVVSGIAGTSPTSGASAILNGGGGTGVQTYGSATLTGGEYTLYIGGKLGGALYTASPANLSGQTADTYNGTANFTVEYN